MRRVDRTFRRPSIVLQLAVIAALLASPGSTGPACAQQSLKERLPRSAPLSPEEALETFQVKHGFSMQLLAHEPMVVDPVAMAYDENGLAYVVEMIDYPHVDKEADVPFTDQSVQESLGRVRVLIDDDGDAKFDRSVVFAEELSWPTGVVVYRGGVFVSATPDIWYLKDTDGDHVADVRKKWFTGFRKFNVQAVMNNLQWGLDHRIYGAGSSNGGAVRAGDKPDAAPVRLARNDFRFDPVHGTFEAISGGARFGNTFDNWGNRFICNIRNPVQHVVLPSRYLSRNPFLPVAAAIHDCAPAGDQLPVYPTSKPEPWRALRARRWIQESGSTYPRSETAAAGFVTSSSGITVYRGSAYPGGFAGNVFLGEVAGNLIHRRRLEPDGPTFSALRTEEESEFLTSTDNWFRPVNFVNAPDGTLHVLDMYRETIEHPWSIPDDIKALLDLRSGSDRGRIYRLVPPGFEQPQPSRLGDAPTAELVSRLESPNAWHRETAHRLLYERQDPAAVRPLRRLLAESGEPLARLHALWSLHGLDALDDSDLAAALRDPSHGVREHAVRLAESRLPRSPLLLDRVLELAGDANVRVRFQVAFSLGEVSDPRALRALARIAQSDAADPWMRTAVISSVPERADQLIALLLDHPAIAHEPATRPMLEPLALIIGVRHRDEELRRTAAAVASADASARLAVLTGLGDGLRRAGKRLWDLAESEQLGGFRELLASSTQEAVSVARAAGGEPALRRQAIELLGHGAFAQVHEPLQSLLHPREPQTVQLAAVTALAGLSDPRVPGVLLAGWQGYSPAVRSEAAEALLGRRDGILPLLEAVAQKKVPLADVSRTRRSLLLKHGDAKIRELAQSLFGDDAIGSRASAIADYQSALALEADAARGREVFRRDCMTCHRHGGEGSDIGPGLETIKNRSPDNVLVHVLDPNREVSPNYLEYVIELTDGRVVTGIIVAETASGLTLRRPENVEQTILRENIAELFSSGKSIMPEGFEQKITPQEMADLLRFLLQ